VSEKEEKKVTAPSKPSVPRVWLRLPPPSNVPSELITDRYAISITNALIAGVIPLNLHIRLQPNEANTEAFMKAVAPTGDQEMLSERLEPQILSALQGVHLNPDGSKVAMMTKGRGKEPKPVKMQGFVPSFKTSFGPNKGQSRPLELTIPYYRLSAVMNSPGFTISYRAGKKYTAFLTSFVVDLNELAKVPLSLSLSVSCRATTRTAPRSKRAAPLPCSTLGSCAFSASCMQRCRRFSERPSRPGRFSSNSTDFMRSVENAALDCRVNKSALPSLSSNPNPSRRRKKSPRHSSMKSPRTQKFSTTRPTTRRPIRLKPDHHTRLSRN